MVIANFSRGKTKRYRQDLAQKSLKTIWALSGRAQYNFLMTLCPNFWWFGMFWYERLMMQYHIFPQSGNFMVWSSVSSSPSYFLFILPQKHVSFFSLVFSLLWPFIQCLGPSWKSRQFSQGSGSVSFWSILMPIRTRGILPKFYKCWKSASLFCLSLSVIGCHNLNILNTLYWIF